MNSNNSKRKPFDPKLHAANDSAARTAVLRYLDRTSIGGWCSNTDQYGVDLVRHSASGDIMAGTEVEIKRVWSGPDFLYDTLQIPSRKDKFARLPYPVEFWVLNAELTHALVIPAGVLAEYTPLEVRNKYVSAGEKFFQVPVDRCNLLELQEG